MTRFLPAKVGGICLPPCAPVALVAEQEIRAAADIEAPPLSRPQQYRLRCQAEFKRYGLVRNQRLGNIRLDCNLGSGTTLVSIFRRAGRIFPRDSA